MKREGCAAHHVQNDKKRWKAAVMNNSRSFELSIYKLNDTTRRKDKNCRVGMEGSTCSARKDLGAGSQNTLVYRQLGSYEIHDTALVKKSQAREKNEKGRFCGAASLA